jgi:hypothetical protein
MIDKISRVRRRACLLGATGVLLAISCGSSSNGAGSGSGLCESGDTRTCVGPAACVGGQVCSPTRAWGACDCGDSQAGAANAGGDAGSGDFCGAAGATSTSSAGQSTAGSSAAGSSTGGSGASGGGSSAAGSGGASFGGGSAEGPCPPNVVGHCDAGVTIDSYPQYAGYTLHTVEDFPAPMDLDSDPIFTWSDGSPPGSSTEFSEENIQFADGRLIIEAQSDCTVQHPKCYPAHPSYAEEGKDGVVVQVPAQPVQSGELRSRYNNYRYGRYEAKFHAPSVGQFFSSLFIFRTPSDATWNEIDFLLTNSHPQQSGGDVISATNQSFPGTNNDSWLGAIDVPLHYQIVDDHVYAFTWTPAAIDWYVDGVSVQHYDGTKPANGTVPLPTTSAKIMMNLWSFGGTTADYPFQAEYDYFRFYKLDTETTYPCSPAPACLETLGVGDYTAASRNNAGETTYGQ